MIEQIFINYMESCKPGELDEEFWRILDVLASKLDTSSSYELQEAISSHVYDRQKESFEAGFMQATALWAETLRQQRWK